MKRVLKSVVLVYLILSVHLGFSQYPDFNFGRLPDFTNLSSHYVGQMTQDQDGYIWIGTRDGLNRFDGHQIKVYRANDSAINPGLPGNQIDHLLVDSMNKVWAATSIGISVYNREYDRFDLVANEWNPAGLEEFYFNDTAIDHFGRLVVCVGHAIYFYDDAISEFRHLITSDAGYISSVTFDNSGGFWIGHVNSGGVAYYSGYDTKQPEIVLESGLHPDKDQISVMDLEVDDQYLWIGIEHGGISRYCLKDGSVKNYFSDTSERFVISLFTATDGRLWSVDYSGVKIYVEEEDRFHGYYHDPMLAGSIRPNLNGLFQDFQGNYYSFYNGDGVYISPVSRGFQLYSTDDRYYWHVQNNNVSAVHEDIYGNLWLGGFNGGIDIFNWARGEMIRYPTTENLPGQLGRGSVLAIYKDSQNRMWVGTHNGGLHLYDETNNSFESWRTDSKNGALSHNDVRAIAEHSDGNIWIGTHGGGVNHFDVAENKVRIYNEANSGLSSDWIHHVMVDSKQRLWVGTAYGLCLLEHGDDYFQKFLAESGRPGALQGNQILTILEDRVGNVWIGTNNGLYLFDESQKDFTRFDLEFHNHFIASIEQDQNGILWIGTLGGLHRFDPVNRDVFHFDENDGTQGSGFNNNASYYNGKDILFFAGTGGVNAFNPDKLNYNVDPPIVRFSRFLLFNREISEYGSNSILEKELNFVDEIVLDHSQNFFSFEFVALNMINPHRNQYAVMMEGFDNDWVYIGSRRQVSYTNLNPGRYVFRAKAANNDDVWNEIGISVKVRILPPWWKTIWFYVILTIFLTLMVLVIFRMRTNSLRKQKKRLVHLVAEQTRRLRKNNKELKMRSVELNRINSVLEERQKLIVEQSEELESQSDNLQKSNLELLKLINTKDKLFSIIAHDLRAPFNTILGFSSLLTEFSDQEDRVQVREHARIIHDSSLVVFNLLENLLYWARTQTNDIQFSPIQADLNEIVNENFSLIEDSANRKEIKVDITQYKNYPVYADINMMRTVVRNLLINSIKFTPRGGQVFISSMESNNRIQVLIKDTGVGMGVSEIEQILTMGAGVSSKGTEGEKGSGLGLVLCNEFIQKNGGRLTIESQPGAGSCFSFSLPRGVKMV